MALWPGTSGFHEEKPGSLPGAERTLSPLIESPSKIRSSFEIKKARLSLNNPNHSLVYLLETEY